MTRGGRQGLARNAAVALGNRAAPGDVEVLAASLTNEPDPVVRAHVAWALGAIGSPDAVHALRSRAQLEPDEAVIREIEAALKDQTRGPRDEVRTHESPTA